MGIKTEHQLLSGMDRYTYDWQLTSKKGWAQLDTPEDASYLGHWANPDRLMVVAFVEGDEYVTTCDTREEWEQTIREIGECYGSVKADAGFNNPKLQAQFNFLDTLQEA